ncbi:MAG: DNA double-strand break repair nuclease NurA [Candidatus Micrarchaeota archaeon]
MLERIRKAAEIIASRETELAEIAQVIRDGGAPASSAEKGLILPVKRRGLDISVCGVDGGLIYERLHGMDLLLSRAVAVNFTYEDSSMKSHSHFPSKFPEHSLDIGTGLDEHESMLWKSLLRLQAEVSVAISALEKSDPDILLMDGSILPLPSDRPAESSPLFPVYEGVVTLYRKLYAECGKRNCQLVGVIKDTRAKRLVESVGCRLGVGDTLLASHLLGEDERTCAMSYSDHSQPVLKDLQDFSYNVKVFYLRPSKDDLPLRIEFLDCGKSADDVASVLCSLSSVSRTFAYPAVLIEADMCAAMNPVDMESVKKQLFALSNGTIRPLRRNCRPFR